MSTRHRELSLFGAKSPTISRKRASKKQKNRISVQNSVIGLVFLWCFELVFCSLAAHGRVSTVKFLFFIFFGSVYGWFLLGCRFHERVVKLISCKSQNYDTLPR
jgi:hypothetical protein